MPEIARRQLLAQVAAAALVTKAARSEADPWDAMAWLNPPAFFARDDGVFRMRPKPKTDFWRKTFTDTISDNAHFLYRTVTGRFGFEARVAGEFKSAFDQAGLMLRHSTENWLKCGTEFFEGRRHASVVITRDFSDWSVMDDFNASGPVWWRIVREKSALNVFASVDGVRFTLVRSGYLPLPESVEVGLMCAAPQGEGFDCSFDRLRLTQP